MPLDEFTTEDWKKVPDSPKTQYDKLDRDTKRRYPHLVLGPNKISFFNVLFSGLDIPVEIEELQATRSDTKTTDRNRRGNDDDFSGVWKLSEGETRTRTKNFSIKGPKAGKVVSPKDAVRKFIEETRFADGSISRMDFSIGPSCIPENIRENHPPLDRCGRITLRAESQSISTIRQVGDAIVSDNYVNISEYAQSFYDQLSLEERISDDEMDYLKQHTRSIMVTRDVDSEGEFTTEDFMRANALPRLLDYLSNQHEAVDLASPIPGSRKVCELSSNSREIVV